MGKTQKRFDIIRKIFFELKIFQRSYLYLIYDTHNVHNQQFNLDAKKLRSNVISTNYYSKSGILGVSRNRDESLAIDE